VCVLQLQNKNKNYKPLIKHHDPRYIALVIGMEQLRFYPSKQLTNLVGKIIFFHEIHKIITKLIGDKLVHIFFYVVN
jgi:hypothetical protein